MEITLEGGDELKAKLNAVQDTIKDSSEVSFIATAAFAIQRQAQLNATGRPGPMVQSGRLRPSITTEIKSNGRAQVGTDVFYAPFVEFGHRQTPGQYVPPLHKRLVASFAPAYPFMEPSIDQCADELEGVYATFLHDIEVEFEK